MLAREFLRKFWREFSRGVKAGYESTAKKSRYTECSIQKSREDDARREATRLKDK
jgi:hypothetical protein